MIASVDLTHPTRLRFFKGDSARPATIARRVYRRARYLALKAARIAVDLGLPEEPIGPQEIPFGMFACGRCDMLTARPMAVFAAGSLDRVQPARTHAGEEVKGECGFCAAELLRARRAA